MGIRVLAVVAGLAALAGCAGYEVDPAALSAEALNEQVMRAAETAYSETPFANGAVSVVTRENGEVKTYRLVPCNNGTAICAGGERGRAGTLTVTPDHHIVQGVYGDRTFYLRPGGAGVMRRGSVDIPLAWNAMVNGVPRLHIEGIYPD